MANVTIQRNAFLFCRYSVALMVWAALILRNVYVLAAVFVILVLSAALTVRWAPMVWLYTQSLGRLIHSADEVLDVKAMRVAHGLGAVLALVCLALIYHESPAAWWAVGAFALLKTASAVGVCPAYKLYGCMAKGGCCAMTGKR